MKKNALQLLKQIAYDNKDFINSTVSTYFIEELDNYPESFLLEISTDEEFEQIECSVSKRDEAVRDAKEFVKENFDFLVDDLTL